MKHIAVHGSVEDDVQIRMRSGPLESAEMMGSKRRLKRCDGRRYNSSRRGSLDCVANGSPPCCLPAKFQLRLSTKFQVGRQQADPNSQTASHKSSVNVEIPNVDGRQYSKLISPRLQERSCFARRCPARSCRRGNSLILFAGTLEADFEM